MFLVEFNKDHTSPWNVREFESGSEAIRFSVDANVAAFPSPWAIVGVCHTRDEADEIIAKLLARLARREASLAGGG